MAQLTREQVRALAAASDAWGSVASDVLVDPDGSGRVYHVFDVATAIAYHESGWNTHAHGVGPRDDSYGLWQINLHKSVGDLSALLKQYAITRPDDLYDPATNARVAAWIYKRMSGWARPWAGSLPKALETLRTWYPNGSDVNSIPGNAQEAGLYPGQLRLEGAVGSAVSGLADLAPALGRILGWIINPSNWRRLGVAVLGIGLVVLALTLANRGLLAGAATTALTKGAA